MKAMLRRSFRSVALIGLAMVTGLAVVALVAGADVTNTLNSLGVSGIGQCPATSDAKGLASGSDCTSFSDVLDDAIARRIAAHADVKMIGNDPGACGIAAAAEAALNNANAHAKISETVEAEAPKAEETASCCMTEKTGVAAKSVDFSAAKVAPVLGTAKVAANAPQSHAEVAKVAPVAASEESECCMTEKSGALAKVTDVAKAAPVAATTAADLECCMDAANAAPAVAAKAEAPVNPSAKTEAVVVAGAPALPECCQVKEVVVIDAPAAPSGN